ncbi:MAG: hypothetical protein ACFBSE_12945 [Prochloraceae cyanobacterium]
MVGAKQKKEQENGSAATPKQEELSSFDENALAGVKFDGNITIDEKYRLDRKNSQKKPKNTIANRPLEDKGSFRLGTFGAIGGGVIVVCIFLYQSLFGAKDAPPRELPISENTTPVVDFAEAPEVDYQGKYALKDQEIDLDEYESRSRSGRESSPDRLVENQVTSEDYSAPSNEIPKVDTTSTITNGDKNTGVLTKVTETETKDYINLDRDLKKVDAISLYRKASAMGGYGQISSNLTAQVKPAIPVIEPIDPYKKEIKNFDKIVPIGSKIQGILLDTIATLDLAGLEDRNFIVQTTEHLSAPSGEIILPSGTQLVVKVSEIHPRGYMKLRAVSLQMISETARDMVKVIPPKSIKINAANGGLLKAKVDKPSNLPQDVLAALFGGVGDAAKIINRPASQSYSKYGDGFSQTIENGDGNVGVAIAGGFSSSMSERMQRRAERQSQVIDKHAPVIVLKAGVKVEIYVNEAFSL